MFDTFMLLSTINALYGAYSPEERFKQTMQSIASIKERMKDSRKIYTIVVIDNSNEPVKKEWVDEINGIGNPDHPVFFQMRHNLFSYVANTKVEHKSIAEANLLFEALNILNQYKLVSNRIFKLSARYRLSKDFNAGEYDQPIYYNKFTFTPTVMSSTEDNWKSQCIKMWYEQILYSFTPANMEFLQTQLLGVIANMQRTGDCLEEVMYHYIPKDLVVPVFRLNVEGNKAQDKGAV